MITQATRPHTKQLLTHSRMQCAKTCLRKHYLSYELRIKPEDKGEALRLGSAFHLGLETLDTDGATAAFDAIHDNYSVCPSYVDESDWAVERQKALQLFAGHIWRWDGDDFNVVATEQEFDIPLINLDNGAVHPHWRLAGKVDRIVRLPDGRLAVQEYKTTGEDIAPDSDYWRRLRMDSQISLYMIAARAMGHDVETVVYDVTRKPTIRLRKDETPDGYGERLRADIGERPDFYYARHEIPRLEDDLTEFHAELWQIAGTLRECQVHHRWFRNTAACRWPFPCRYFEICANSLDPVRDGVPRGFETSTTPHPELTGA